MRAAHPEKTDPLAGSTCSPRMGCGSGWGYLASGHSAGTADRSTHASIAPVLPHLSTGVPLVVFVFRLRCYLKASADVLPAPADGLNGQALRPHFVLQCTASNRKPNRRPDPQKSHPHLGTGSSADRRHRERVFLVLVASLVTHRQRAAGSSL